MELRGYQNDLLEAAREKFRAGRKRLIFYAPTGSGKCLGRGTPVLMADGTIKAVENVRSGDVVMGPDSGGRIVSGVVRGSGELFRVTPTKGDSYVVNKSHLLSFVMTGNKDGVFSPYGQRCMGGEIVHCTPRYWRFASKTFKHCAKGWRTGVDFMQAKKLPIPPYILGAWLGDGSTHAPAISSMDAEVVKAWIDYAESVGNTFFIDHSKPCPTYHLSCGQNGGDHRTRKRNVLIDELRGLKLFKEIKFIPQSYKTATKIERLELLAGIIDTDGHLSNGYYDLIFKSQTLANDIAFVARSLGFACYVKSCQKRATNSKSEKYGTYFRASISGNVSEIPCKIARKKAVARKQKKNVLHVGVRIDPIGVGEYFGFSLTGPDRLFLLGDFTVTHNTECGMAMIRAARLKNTRVIFVANRIGLVEQASRRFYKSGIEHGVIQGSNTRNADAGVLVCSIQTLRKRGFPQAGLILIDEAHAAAGSESYQNLIMEYDKCPVIGLSATPFSRGLGKDYSGFGKLFEDIVWSVTIKQLIEMGYLVDVDIWAPSTPDLSGVQTVAGDYNEKQLAAVVDKPQLVGDIVNHWKRLGQNKQTVCFATNIAHSKHIMEQFISAGISCEHIDCYTSDDDRNAILARVNSGATRIVTNCAVLAEGWDQPSVKVMICARPTKSLVRWIQMSGRILRPYEGGAERAIILDHSGTATRLGFPMDDLPLKLDDGKPKKSAEGEREEPLPTPCKACFFVKPPKTHKCPECGFAPEKKDTIEVEDGKLEMLRRRPLKKATTAEKNVIYSEMLGYAKEKNMKPGWAYFAAKEIFGSAPRTGLAARPPTQETRDIIRYFFIKRAKARQVEQKRAGESNAA